MNKIFNIFLSACITLVILSCNGDEQSRTNCDQLPEWHGYDAECGCFGEAIAFSERCITSFEQDDIPYFGYVNYGHIKDSILIIVKKSKDRVSIKTLSDFPSLDSQSADLEWYLTNSRSIQLLYDATHWNNEDAMGKGTELRLDPNIILAEPDEFTIELYQREFLSLGSEILDSAAITVRKEIGRK